MECRLANKLALRRFRRAGSPRSFCFLVPSSTGIESNVLRRSIHTRFRCSARETAHSPMAGEHIFSSPRTPPTDLTIPNSTKPTALKGSTSAVTDPLNRYQARNAVPWTTGPSSKFADDRSAASCASAPSMCFIRRIVPISLSICHQKFLTFYLSLSVYVFRPQENPKRICRR